MLGENFIGMITKVTGKAIIKKLEDGTKVNDNVVNIKLESADIDYESIEKFNPAISATLLNIQPMPFRFISFGEQEDYKFGLKIRSKEDNQLPNMPDFPEFDYLRVLIKDLSIKIKENIPIYHFTIDIPSDNINNKHLMNFLKQPIEFEFNECK